MEIRFTPQLGVASGIALIAALIALGPLTTGPGSHPLPVTDLKIAGLAADKSVVPGEVAMRPLAPAYAAAPEANPFVLRDKTQVRTAKIPFPPPPPLTAPEPVVLPLPVDDAQPEAQP